MEPVKSSLRTSLATHVVALKHHRAAVPTKATLVKVKVKHLALIKEALVTLVMTSASVEATIIGTKTVVTSQMTSADQVLSLRREK